MSRISRKKGALFNHPATRLSRLLMSPWRYSMVRENSAFTCTSGYLIILPLPWRPPEAGVSQSWLYWQEVGLCAFGSFGQSSPAVG